MLKPSGGPILPCCAGSRNPPGSCGFPQQCHCCSLRFHSRRSCRNPGVRMLFLHNSTFGMAGSQALFVSLGCRRRSSPQRVLLVLRLASWSFSGQTRTSHTRVLSPASPRPRSQQTGVRGIGAMGAQETTSLWRPGRDGVRLGCRPLLLLQIYHASPWRFASARLKVCCSQPGPPAEGL